MEVVHVEKAELGPRVLVQVVQDVVDYFATVVLVVVGWRAEAMG